MLDLKVFQTHAAQLIAERYAFFANHPDRPWKGGKTPRPFFQALSAITGAGKTPMLAQAVALMRAHFSAEPIVFWISKAKSVVAQTFTNFSGGKYSEIVDGFTVINVGQLTPGLISDGSTPLLVLATTGLFNNKDQAEGALNIYKQDADLFGNQSPWERLIERLDKGKRRPLLIVYDEGHNLSPQQTELLAELEPDAYLLASATLKLPDAFNKSVIQHIKLWVDDAAGDVAAFEELHALNEHGEPDIGRFVTTTVRSEDVVDAQLIKRAIQFDGTTAAMEHCLDELTARLGVLQEEIDLRGLGFRPKAIYVSKTNIGDDGQKDDHALPFQQRQAPPIRIWRYLVEKKGVDPKSIAIYANLAFADGTKPDELNLFSKGDSDFDDFTTGDYQHIIFNLALQEGWDDPACYLAYIDKSMGSSVQVEQIIGRALRQYNATHYDNALLNSAHFFLRVDKQSVFVEAIDAVKKKLQKEGAPIEIISNFSGSSSGAMDIKPKDDVSVSLSPVRVEADAAASKIAELVSQFTTFSEGTVDTIAQAHAAKKLVDLKKLDGEDEPPSWIAHGQTNPVRLRWLVNNALRSRSNRALAATNLKGAKFDVRVQAQSNAHKQAESMAANIVKAYFQHSELVYASENEFPFGTMRVPKAGTSFTNGLYERYHGFNKFELAFAQAIDASNFTWHRNPSAGGFSIPLLSEGDTASFYPDFIVWKKDLIYCLDTKGGHLLSDAVARKLFDIQDSGKTKIQVRFISEGTQSELRGKAVKGGYTVWKMKSGNPTPIHVDDLKDALRECLK
ncbi:DEAD/DEAH box helicase family protein [Paraburkholderia ginsengisoli]|uniref:DEAD/DEAH box helicase family protein n=1 Tax=Paraburkholderia ginsengisoli TaxID=311231 RepID=A0A7T4N039_9BURK|nr:DEAD/DEAH box helicase family protein [Paraburkholderia ginsengisoli]QQC62776.1 DEAD/DEAH box helicase family protein [Paraburkholderia ginsengisoli]